MTDALKEAQEISNALRQWFASQEIDMAHGVMAMAYLIGSCAAESAESFGDLASRLNSAEELATATAAAKFLARM